MRILFTGGGTLGSVTPLLAVAHEMKERGWMGERDCVWIGTHGGPERDLVLRAGIPFFSIATGKIRRYIHWKNIIDPFLMIGGFFHACVLVARFRPDVIVNAGSYVGAPVIVAGWIMRRKTVIIQLDVEPVRSNLITAPIATAICVAVPETARYFPTKKTTVTGIPVRRMAQEDETSVFNAVSLDRHTLLITGGGTGAQRINELVLSSLDRLTQIAEVIHYTGVQKEGESKKAAQVNARYYPIAFGMEIADLARADVVVTRAGMGTIAELSVLGKPSIVIPIPDSPQEKNAAYVQAYTAAVVLSQKNLTAEKFSDAVIELLGDSKRRKTLGEHMSRMLPRDAASRVSEVIQKVGGESHD